ncbi:MAG: hypothetical protein QF839_08275, partial [Candidatus Poseidoniaceae archaeon]|nr:hypothetical protein [Candidatus Poseidoniaceae archaeon]
ADNAAEVSAAADNAAEVSAAADNAAAAVEKAGQTTPNIATDEARRSGLEGRLARLATAHMI